MVDGDVGNCGARDEEGTSADGALVRAVGERVSESRDGELEPRVVCDGGVGAGRSLWYRRLEEAIP